jgi:DNA-binding transcriptional regulator YiaG
MVSAWERGLSRPRARRWPKIEAILGQGLIPAGEDLPGRLLEARLRLGLFREEFAARFGFDAGILGHWERRSKTPGPWNTARIVAVLERLEAEGGQVGGAREPQQGVGLGQLRNFFDLTRWRQRIPPQARQVGPKTLGEFIRKRRLQLGLSQEALGRRLGVGRVTIQWWESGALQPPSRLYAAVAEFLRGGGP